MRGEGDAMRNIPAAKWLELARLVAGAWGTVLLVRAVDGAAVDLRLALPAAALFAALAWLPGLRPSHGWQPSHGWRRWSGAALAALGLGLLLALPAVRAEFAGLAAVLRGAPQGPAATRAAIVLGGGLALLAALCEGALCLRALACAPAVLALLSAPLFGIDPGAPAVFLLFAFLLAVPLPGGGAGRLRALRLPALALAAAFAASAVLSALGAEGVYQAVYRAEGWVQRSMQRMSGGSAAVSDGTVRRGNLYPAGTAQLSVTLDRAPQETVYLRGFTGGDYLGGAWAPADDEAIFQRMEENWLHWDEWADWIPGLYRSLYYAMNYSTVRPDWPEPRRMDIRLLVETEQAFSPYFSMESLWNPRRGEEHHYSFRYYEQGEMAIDWDSLPGSLNATRDWYRETQDAYIAEIASYTVLPAEGLDRLRALAAENPVHDAVQATEFVRAALASAAYTQTPGLFPVNRDPVEYFLFDGHAGYCQHFASAAVLLYRLQGVPARYVAGYAVPASAFVQQGDGSYSAVVTDEQAHAWAEIFVEDMGWMPVEVTLALGAADAGLLPAGEGAAGTWNLSLLEGVSAPQLGEDAAVQAGAESPAIAPLRLDGAQWSGAAFYLALLGCAALALRRLRALRRMETCPARAACAHLLRAVRFSGRLRGAQNEEEILARLPEICPGLCAEQAQRLLALLRRAAFARAPLPAAEEEEARALCRCAAQEIARTLPPLRRLAYRFVWNFA